MNAEREKKSIKHFKRSLFSTPKDDWPTRFDTGLSMDHIESTLNLHRASTNIQSSSSLLEFKFVHSKEYYMGQCAFLDAIDTHDPNSISKIDDLHLFLK